MTKFSEAPDNPTADYDSLAWQNMRSFSFDTVQFRPDSSFLLEWPEERDEKNDQDRLLQAKSIIGNLAADNAGLDYFTKNIPTRPKHTIGAYVADQGFRVPLVRDDDDWQTAKANGTAMLRSELAQDYDGIPGLFTSTQLTLPQFSTANTLLTRAVLAGELSETEYMEAICGKDLLRYYRELAGMSIPKKFWLAEDGAYQPIIRASRWHYVPGLNITMFQDPHVPGRYHFGTSRRDYMNWEENSKSSGYVEADQHALPIQRRDYNQVLIAERVIELYESIKTLPYFDATNAPVMEMQLDDSGELHFLQYYRTTHSVAATEPFDLPGGGTKYDYVRGVTPESGVDKRLYVRIDTLTDRVIGQAAFLGNTIFEAMRDTIISRVVDVVFANCGVSLRGTHGAKSLLYAPKLGIDAWHTGEGINLSDLAWRTQHQRTPGNAYIHAHVTSNGREAVMESDSVVYYDDPA